MSEKQIPNPEKIERAGGEKPPTKDPAQTVRGLGKVAVDGSKK